MKSFWSFQVQAQGVKNKQRLLDYHRRVKPPWTVVLEGDALALEIKAASPTTNVISRHFFEDGTWYKASPKDYLDYLDRAKVPDELWCFVENESGIKPEWNIELIRLNAQRAKPRKLAILSLAVGTPPNPDEWKDPKVLELLRLCDQYREHVVLCLHEYFIAVVTSGLIGGAPDNAGQPLNSIQIGENLVPKDKWPKKERNLTRWHMGRFAFMVNACKAANPPINPPRVVLTEAGADDVSDIKPWAEKLEMTPPHTSIRGWRSLVNQWTKWYPGVSTDQVYADMLTYAADVYYADSVVEGGCIYCWATPDPKWEQFNVEPYEDFIAALEKAVDVPKLIEKPANANSPKTARVAHHAMDLRYGPGTSFKKLDGDTAPPEIQVDDKITYWQPYSFVIDRQWAYTEVHTGSNAGKKGWISVTDLQSKATQPIPVITPPDNPPVIVPVPPPTSTPIPVPTEPPSSTIPEPPVTNDDTPAIQHFKRTLEIEVTGTSSDAADDVALFAAATLKYQWQTFVEHARLAGRLGSIQDVQFIYQMEIKP